MRLHHIFFLKIKVVKRLKRIVFQTVDGRLNYDLFRTTTMLAFILFFILFTTL